MTAQSKVSAAGGEKHRMTKAEMKIIFATSLGTVFEWYDFYIFGTLTAIMGAHFFGNPNLSPSTQFIFALLAFAAGFAVRPFGAVVFGRLGDLVGRKYTFLVTIMLMGGSTFLIGLLPTYAQVGVLAPVLLISLRLLQGLALGGEYGGAATYVAEHAPANRRGEYTSWIQTTATLGFFLAIIVYLLVQNALLVPMPAEAAGDAKAAAALGWDKDAAFKEWGWRIPYLLSAVLLAVSVWIRLKLNESPIYQKMKSEGKHSKSPIKDSFGKWSNLKFVLLALFGMVAGQGVIWYTSQFYAQIFLINSVRLDPQTANIMIAVALLLGTPFFIVFAKLSDRIGRKKVILAGLVLAAITYIPIFKAITHYANPALEAAVATSPVVVKADPANCNPQFDPIGKTQFTTPCDVLTSYLAKKGIPYDKEAGEAGSMAVVKIGAVEVTSYDAALPAGVDKTDAAALKAAKDTIAANKKKFEDSLSAALTEAKYPAKANPEQVNHVMVVILLFVLLLYTTMAYGPIAAALVELFPTRIRYTSMSLPYHIGNGWFGGFLPATSFAIVVATGNIYAGLWYPIIIALVTVVIGALFLHETKGVDITTDEHK